MSQQMIDQMKELRLSFMVQALELQQKDPVYAAMGFEERLLHLVQAEIDGRRNKKRMRLHREAKLPDVDASLESILYYPDRELNREQLMNLSSCKWIESGQNVLITGASGAGKSWIAAALGNAACDHFYTCAYIRMPEMLDLLSGTRDELWEKTKKRLIKVELLIIDDVLLEPISTAQSRELLEIVESRYRSLSTVICSQLSPGGWHKAIKPAPIADAILDRLVFGSHTIHIKGEMSMRKRITLGL